MTDNEKKFENDKKRFDSCENGLVEMNKFKKLG